MDELERVLERKVREFASRILGHPQGAALDRGIDFSTEPEISKFQNLVK